MPNKVYAESSICTGVINWNALSLTHCQKIKIQEIEYNWQLKDYKIRQEIYNDQAKLRYLLSSHFVSENQIRYIHQNILNNQQKLREIAMDNFFQKRNVLNYYQKKKLHSMLCQKYFNNLNGYLLIPGKSSLN